MSLRLDRVRDNHDDFDLRGQPASSGAIFAGRCLKFPGLRRLGMTNGEAELAVERRVSVGRFCCVRRYISCGKADWRVLMQASARTSLQPGPPPPYRRRLDARYGVGQQTRLRSAIESHFKGKQRRGGRSNFNRLSLQSEFLQIHKAINSQPVSIVLPPLNKRGNARFKQGPMTTIRGTVIERGEDAPYPIGYPLDCHLMHHEIPFERPNTESTTLGESARLTAASSRSQQWRNRPT